tara:strand:+ start:2732 stop:3616 length:885 start_codon:yes stop_codon:yes gene_type:complete
MLFDRFIFVLYILFHYSWFLLGTLFQQPLRYCSVISLALSLLSVVIVSFFQLQSILHKGLLDTSDKWSGISWAVVHLVICLIFIVDGLEWANPLVIFGIAGLLMSAVIIVVGGCACFVIMQNGNDWHAHIHLTCVSFWVIIQYMILRLPEMQFQCVTVIPIALMTLTRLTKYDITKKEILAWFICSMLHVLYDVQILDREAFFWSVTAVIMLMVLKEIKNIVLMTLLPFGIMFAAIYVCILLMCGNPIQVPLRNLGRIYNDYMIPDDSLIILPDGRRVIPLDSDYFDDDWERRL